MISGERSEPALLVTYSRLLRYGPLDFSRDAIAQGGELGPLLALGIVETAGNLDTVVCDECDEPHVATVVSDGDQLGWRCQEVGLILDHGKDLTAYRLRPDIFAERLAKAMELRGRVVGYPRGSNWFWSLGHRKFNEYMIAVYFVPNVADPEVANEVNAHIGRRQVKTAGIALLTSDEPDLIELTFRRDARTVGLQAVISLTPSPSLIVDFEILAKLVLPTGLLNSIRPGRAPEQRRRIWAVLEDLGSSGAPYGTSNADLRRVREKFKSRYGMTALPAQSTIRIAIEYWNDRGSS